MTTMTVMVAKFCYIRLAQLSHGGEEEDLDDFMVKKMVTILMMMM